MSYDVLHAELTPEQRNARISEMERQVVEMQFTTNMLSTLHGMSRKVRSISCAYIKNHKLNSAQRTTLKLLNERMARLSVRVSNRRDVGEYARSQMVHALRELQVRVKQTLAVSALH